VQRLIEADQKKIDPLGLVGGYASRFDLIAKEYGWSDEQIGELPLMRFQQIVNAISLRKYREDRQETSRISWLARTISQYVAGGYMTDGQRENVAVRYASQIAFDHIEEAALEAAAAREALKARTNETVMKEPARGSFEKMMQFMGQKRD